MDPQCFCNLLIASIFYISTDFFFTEKDTDYFNEPNNLSKDFWVDSVLD